MLPDDLIVADGAGCLRQMIDLYERAGGSVLAVQRVPRADSQRYGMVGVSASDGSTHEVETMVEKPAPADAPSELAVVGRYVLSPTVMQHLATQSPVSTV